MWKLCALCSIFPRKTIRTVQLLRPATPHDDMNTSIVNQGIWVITVSGYGSCRGQDDMHSECTHSMWPGLYYLQQPGCFGLDLGRPIRMLTNH